MRVDSIKRSGASKLAPMGIEMSPEEWAVRIRVGSAFSNQQRQLATRGSFKKMKQHVPADVIVFDQRLAPVRGDPFDEVLRPGLVHMRMLLGIHHNDRVRVDEERIPVLKGAVLNRTSLHHDVDFCVRAGADFLLLAAARRRRYAGTGARCCKGGPLCDCHLSA